MVLTPELIKEAKRLFPIAAFVKSEVPIAKHKLFNQFAAMYPNWPKLIFYILMDEVFEIGYDERDLGYKATFNPELIPDDLKPK